MSQFLKKEIIYTKKVITNLKLKLMRDSKVYPWTFIDLMFRVEMRHIRMVYETIRMLPPRKDHSGERFGKTW